MKSLLFISLMNGGAWGGSEELWFQTALYAAKNGYTVGCAFYDWPQKAERMQQLREAGCKLYIFPNRGKDRGTFFEHQHYKLTKRWVKWYAYHLPFSKYDKVIINLGHLEILEYYWKRFFTRLPKYSLLFHVYDDNDHVWEKRKEYLRQWLLRAEHNLLASARIKAFLEREVGIEVPNTDTLINPLSFKAPEEPASYPPLQNGNYVFVMLATLDTRRKAQDNLISALSTPKWKDRNWQLHLYGGGEAEQRLKEQIKTAGMEGRISLEGHTRDVKAVLQGAHLLLQMTHIDAMPLAVMEALAMARPMAVSNVGDMPKWVLENVNGWVGENASVEQIDQTLEKAWQERHRWEEMGEASFQLFKEKLPPVPEAYLLEQLKR